VLYCTGGVRELNEDSLIGAATVVESKKIFAHVKGAPKNLRK